LCTTGEAKLLEEFTGDRQRQAMPLAAPSEWKLPPNADRRRESPIGPAAGSGIRQRFRAVLPDDAQQLERRPGKMLSPRSHWLTTLGEMLR